MVWFGCFFVCVLLVRRDTQHRVCVCVCGVCVCGGCVCVCVWCATGMGWVGWGGVGVGGGGGEENMDWCVTWWMMRGVGVVVSCRVGL